MAVYGDSMAAAAEIDDASSMIYSSVRTIAYLLKLIAVVGPIINCISL